MAYIYIVRCDDGSLYTGITTDIGKRMKNHLSGKGASHAKYMRSRHPVEIAALWQTDEYKVAAKLEYAIKRLKRGQKLLLIEEKNSICDIFPSLSEFSFVRVEGITLEKVLSCDENENDIKNDEINDKITP